VGLLLGVLTVLAVYGVGLVSATTGGPVPSYLDPVVFLGILVAWAVVPPLIGYLQFRRADLS
jgi:ABC-2 type transport system permease protein